MDRVRFYPHCFHAWEGEAKPHRLRPRWQQQVAGLCHRVLPGVVERYGGAGVVTATVLYLAGMGESVSSGNMELANSAQGVEVDFYFCFLSLEQLMWGSHEEGCRAAVQPGGQCWGCSCFCLQRRFLALCSAPLLSVPFCGCCYYRDWDNDAEGTNVL